MKYHEDSSVENCAKTLVPDDADVMTRVEMPTDVTLAKSIFMRRLESISVIACGTLVMTFVVPAINGTAVRVAVACLVAGRAVQVERCTDNRQQQSSGVGCRDRTGSIHVAHTQRA